MDWSVVGEILKQGLGVAFGIFMSFLYLQERKRNETLNQQVFDIGVKAIDAQTRVTMTLEQQGKLMDSTLNLVTKGASK